jgi:hypothetical protein
VTLDERAKFNEYLKLSCDFAKLAEVPSETRAAGFAFKVKEEDKWWMRFDIKIGIGQCRRTVPDYRGGERQ